MQISYSLLLGFLSSSLSVLFQPTMVSGENNSIISGVRVSTVVPAAATGENTEHELSDIDLAMKLHYLTGLYYFHREAAAGLDIHRLKNPMFLWLEKYSPVAGRIRRRGSGRPFIKCNDSGVRITEAKCGIALEEWLVLRDPCLYRHLVSDKKLGPELGFSPLVHIQITWFKCGGISVGMSWSHVLGDAFSASYFMNMWGEIMAGTPESNFLPLKSSGKTENTHIVKPAKSPPLAIKQVEPVGDCWEVSNNCQMETISFQIPSTQIKQLLSRISDGTTQIQPFEALSAVIWQCIAKIRNENKPNVVTVCRSHSAGRINLLGNEQVLSTVKANFSVAESGILELAILISEAIEDERMIIEDEVKKETSLDFIVYGGNLTFVNLEGVDLYELKLNGQRPVHVNYCVDGVGPEGVVLVLPKPESDTKGNDGRTVTVTLPGNEISQLGKELNKDWSISY